jgi:hypothetical protein
MFFTVLLLIAQCKSSKVKLLITYNAFFIEQGATAQSKTGNFRCYSVAEVPPGFQAGWSDYMYYFSFYVRYIFPSGIF